MVEHQGSILQVKRTFPEIRWSIRKAPPPSRSVASPTSGKES